MEETDCVTILELGAEGGSLTFLGQKSSEGTWNYMLHRNEVATFDSLPEEEQTESATSNSAVVKSWQEALELLSKYETWHNLYPINVHQDFEVLILSEVRRRGGDKAVSRWEDRINQEKALSRRWK